MKIFNKLVRDKIPEIIINDGEKPITRILSKEEYKKELDNKLLEEVNEYLTGNIVEELADIFEVLYSIMDTMNITKEELEEIRLSKRLKRGGFEERIFLERIE